MIVRTVWLRTAVLCAAMLSATACDPEEVVASNRFCDQNARVNVSVASDGGQAPSISWTPGCRAALVLVEDANEEDLWVLSGDAGIAPGVRYGSTPAGSVVDEGPEPLVPGSEYVVSVFGGPPGSGDDYPLGSASFVAR